MNPVPDSTSPKREILTPVRLAVLVGMVGLVVYLLRLTPGMGWYDSPEFAGVATWLGIAHPTGYPLYSLLGRLSTILFFPLSDPATRVNLLSALGGGATLTVLTLLAWRMIGLLRLGPLPRAVRLLAAVLPAAVLGTMRLFMEQAVVAEVYTLHTLAAALLLYLGLGCVLKREQRPVIGIDVSGGRIGERIWGAAGWRLPFLTAYLAGLALGNHVTLALYLPALAMLLWWAVRPESSMEDPGRPVTLSHTARVFVPLLLVGLLGLTLYLLLPLRASLDPPFNWGGADNGRNLMRLLTAAEARGREAQFYPITVIGIWGRLAGGMSWPVLGIALLGWVWAAIRRRGLGLLTLIYLVFPLLFLLLALDILEDALLPVHLWIALGTAAAAVLTGERLVALVGPKWGGRAAVSAVVVLVALGPGQRLITNWNEVSAVRTGGPRTYMQALIASVAGEPEPGEDVRGWVFAEDNTTAFLLWNQARVEGRHPSLHGIYLLLVREEWYRQELRRRVPSLAIPDLPRSVEGQPHQVAGRALVKANEGVGVPLFVHPVILPPEWVYGSLVPQGVLFRVEPEGYQPTVEDIRRHASIMRRWAPALQDSLGELDALSRDVWSYQHELQGDAWAQLGMWEIAEAEYQAGLRINPRRVEPWVALGAFHAATGDWERATMAYLGALELAPGDVELQFELTRSLTSLGRFAEADSLLPRTEPPGRSRAVYLQLRARIRGGLGEFESSREDLEQAAALAPESGEIQNDLGVLLLTAGDRGAAREVFERAVQLEPGLAEAWSNLGNLAFQDGRTSEADEAFQRAIEAGADAPQIRHTLGLLRFTIGDLPGAETVLRENLQRWPRHADTYMTLGAVLEARGELRQAMAVYEQGRMANPADSRFSRELRRLRNPPSS